MQIDRGFLQVTVSEQHLDGPQVGSGLEQMGGEAMAKGVWMNMLVRETGAFGRMQAGPPKHLSVYGTDGLKYAGVRREKASASAYDRVRANIHAAL